MNEFHSFQKFRGGGGEGYGIDRSRTSSNRSYCAESISHFVKSTYYSDLLRIYLELVESITECCSQSRETQLEIIETPDDCLQLGFKQCFLQRTNINTSYWTHTVSDSIETEMTTKFRNGRVTASPRSPFWVKATIKKNARCENENHQIAYCPDHSTRFTIA